MRNRGSVNGTLLGIFFILLTTATVAGFLFKGWMPPVASDHGRGVDSVITYILVVSGVIFVIGHGVLAWFIFKYQGGQTEYKAPSHKAEWIWALVPVLFMTLASEVGVLVIGGPAWSKVYEEGPKDALLVEVVGQQFKWFVRYPGKDGKLGRVISDRVRTIGYNVNRFGLDNKDKAAEDDITTEGTLRVPVGRPVKVLIRSYDVLHSFAVPAFRIKQDAVPGFTSVTRFTPTQEGRFELSCAELCGAQHFTMKGVVIVMSKEKFEEWLDSEPPFSEMEYFE